MSSTLRPTKIRRINKNYKEIRRIIEKYKKGNIKKIITTKKTI